MWKDKGIRRAKTILKKENKIEGKGLPVFNHYSNQDWMVLEEGQTYTSTGQNRESRNRLTQICLTDF